MDAWQRRWPPYPGFSEYDQLRFILGLIPNEMFLQAKNTLHFIFRDESALKLQEKFIYSKR
jgi:hypothetical protein